MPNGDIESLLSYTSEKEPKLKVDLADLDWKNLDIAIMQNIIALAFDIKVKEVTLSDFLDLDNSIAYEDSYYTNVKLLADLGMKTVEIVQEITEKYSLKESIIFIREERLENIFKQAITEYQKHKRENLD